LLGKTALGTNVIGGKVVWLLDFELKKAALLITISAGNSISFWTKEEKNEKNVLTKFFNYF
jgi:hypothetical protein